MFYALTCNAEKLRANYYIYYQLEKTGKKYGNGLLKIQKYDFNNLNIVNPLIITNSDKKKLIELSENIMKKKKKNGIEKISFILSKYMNMEFEKIIEIYNLIKANRLEAQDV